MESTNPPTRQKWKDLNPTVALRTSLANRQKLEQWKNETGMTLGELLHVGLGLVQRQVVDGRAKYWQGHKAGVQKGREEGLDEGFADGLSKVEIVCCKCRQRFIADRSDPVVKAALDQAFRNLCHSGGYPD
jgi:hypothetical protein